MSAAAGESAILAVRVKPRARRSGLLGWHGDGIKAAVRAAPERGRANDELLDVLACALGVPRDDLEIVAGATSQEKKVRLHGVSAVDLAQRLRVLLDDTP